MRKTQKTTWYLFDAKEEPSGEMGMFYTDGVRQFWLCGHPTRAFNYYIKASASVTPKEKNKLLNAWIENAIGPKDEFFDRIQKFEL